MQATCSRILIISGGKLVADGTPDELRSREKATRYRYVVDGSGLALPAIKEKLVTLKGVSTCKPIAGEDGTLTFAIDGAASADLRKPLFQMAVDNKWALLELVRESASLEDVFRNLTTGEETKS